MRERPLFSKDSTLVHSNRYWDLVKQRADTCSPDNEHRYKKYYKNCRRGDTIDVQKNVILYHYNELLNHTNAIHDAKIPTDQGAILADFDVDPSAITEVKSDKLTPGVVLHVERDYDFSTFDNNLVGVTEPASKFVSDVLQQCDNLYNLMQKNADDIELCPSQQGITCFEAFYGLAYKYADRALYKAYKAKEYAKLDECGFFYPSQKVKSNLFPYLEAQTY